MLASALVRPTKRTITDASGSDADSALSAAAAAGIIDLIGDQVKITHSLFAAVLYSDAVSEERRNAHHRLAAWRPIQKSEPGTWPRQRKVRIPRSPCCSTRQRPMHRRRARRLRRASSSSLPRGSRHRIAKTRGSEGSCVPQTTSSWPGTTRGSLPSSNLCWARSPSGPIRAEVHLRLGEAVHVGYEDHRRAAAMLSETAEQDGVAPGLASRIPNSLAWAQAATSLHQEGILAETVDLAERAGDEAALASALAHLAALRMWLGQGIDRRAFARAIALKGPLETHVAHADALADVGELAEAERMFNELLRLATEHGDEGSVGDALLALYAGSEVGVAVRVAGALGDVVRARGSWPRPG